MGEFPSHSDNLVSLRRIEGQVRGVQRMIEESGQRWEANAKYLPGSPDIVLPDRNIAVFVHGCFWHRHDSCSRATFPKTNKKYWRAKFKDNIARDRDKELQLQEQGWKVVIIWECEASNAEVVKSRLGL